MGKEFSALQIFESIANKDEKKEYVNALELLTNEKKKNINILENQRIFLENQMFEFKDIIEADRKRYGELRRVLEYGHR